jgi:hypothetical protein
VATNINPLPHTPSWDSAKLVKHRDNFTFLPLLRFSLPILIFPIAPQSPSITWGWYSRPVVAAVPSGLSVTPLRVVIIVSLGKPYT